MRMEGRKKKYMSNETRENSTTGQECKRIQRVEQGRIIERRIAERDRNVWKR
jgi:hypothetical protein